MNEPNHEHDRYRIDVLKVKQLLLSQYAPGSKERKTLLTVEKVKELSDLANRTFPPEIFNLLDKLNSFQLLEFGLKMVFGYGVAGLGFTLLLGPYALLLRGLGLFAIPFGLMYGHINLQDLHRCWTAFRKVRDVNINSKLRIAKLIEELKKLK
jgi:hypothetical protein